MTTLSAIAYRVEPYRRGAREELLDPPGDGERAPVDRGSMVDVTCVTFVDPQSLSCDGPRSFRTRFITFEM